MPQCGSTPPSGSRFCNACGYDLTSIVANSGFTSTDKNIESTALTAPDPERRHLTVMFCDLVDSTKLAEGLDPEDLRSVVCSYQEICTAVVEQYQGHIGQFLGDGLLIYFGYPHAHDNDTERALRAVTSLGKLWLARGKRNEVRELVFRVFDQFTEGFNTADLVNARALIKELS